MSHRRNLRRAAIAVACMTTSLDCTHRATAPLADGTGTGEIEAFDVEARFDDRPTMLTLTQTSRVTLRIGEVTIVARAVTGATLLGAAPTGDAGAADTTSLSLHHELELGGPGVTVVTDAALSGAKGTGQLVVGRDVVGAFDEKSFDWVGPCAP